MTTVPPETPAQEDLHAEALDEQPKRTAAELDPRLLVDEQGIRGYATAFGRRVRSGELGVLPVIVGLIVIWLVFWSKQHAFLSAQNLSNLTLQMVTVGAISLGIVLVLLLGEVDLSVGSISGVTAAIVAALIVHSAQNQVLAVVIALACGAAIGLIQGFFFAILGVPAFVVTLAGFLGWAGLQLNVLGSTGTITVSSGFVHNLTFTFLPHYVAYIIVAVLAVISLLAQVAERLRRARADLRPRPLVEIVVRTVLLAALLWAVTFILDHYQGVPLGIVIFVAFVVVFDLVIRKTTYGRHILAVGGSIEAARRAGISVAAIRMSVFSLSGLMAAVGGVLSVSYMQSVDGNTGGSTTLLYAIAAAVIGGTSLFGGRGSAYSALLGVLVVESIQNGMVLLTLPSATQEMVTGGVLLAAVTLDAVTRRTQGGRKT